MLLGAITALSALWLGMNLFIAFTFETYTFSARSLLSLVLWMFCLSVLWAGVSWGAAAGLSAGAISLISGLGAVEQAIFIILMTGICAYYSGKLLRRTHLGLAAIWAVSYASRLEDISSATILLSALLLLLIISYSVGRSSRHLTEKQECARRALHELERTNKDKLTEQRRTLSRDLHDIVAHDITVIAMQAEAAQLSGNPAKRDQTLRIIRDSSRSTLQDLRRIVDTLREEGVVTRNDSEQDPLLSVHEGVRKFAEDLEQLQIPTETRITGDWRTVSRSVQSAVYRILQECTTNVIKYGARNSDDKQAMCWIEAEATEQHVNLHVKNRLPSATAQTMEGCFSSRSGVMSIEHRARAFGGTVRIGPDNSGNWSARVLHLSKS